MPSVQSDTVTSARQQQQQQNIISDCRKKKKNQPGRERVMSHYSPHLLDRVNTVWSVLLTYRQDYSSLNC